MNLTYHKLAEKVPLEKRAKVSEKLVDIILKSKNVEKMPSVLANAILYFWQRDSLTEDEGLAALLEAASLMEPDETKRYLEQELQPL